MAAVACALLSAPGDGPIICAERLGSGNVREGADEDPLKAQADEAMVSSKDGIDNDAVESLMLEMESSEKSEAAV